MSDQNNHKPQPIPTSLAGYVRRQGDTIRVSINVDAFNNCVAYTTPDGQSFVALEISHRSLKKVISGERVVTTIVQRGDVDE